MKRNRVRWVGFLPELGHRRPPGDEPNQHVSVEWSHPTYACPDGPALSVSQI